MATKMHQFNAQYGVGYKIMAEAYVGKGELRQAKRMVSKKLNWTLKTFRPTR